jgi:hypothetical protein
LTSPVVRPAMIYLLQGVEEVGTLVSGEGERIGVTIPTGAKFGEKSVDRCVVGELNGEDAGRCRRDLLLFPRTVKGIGQPA